MTRPPLFSLSPGEAEYLAQSDEERRVESARAEHLRRAPVVSLRDEVEVRCARLEARIGRHRIPVGELEELLEVVDAYLARPLATLRTPRDVEDTLSHERAIARSTRIAALAVATLRSEAVAGGVVDALSSRVALALDAIVRRVATVEERLADR